MHFSESRVELAPTVHRWLQLMTVIHAPARSKWLRHLERTECTFAFPGGRAGRRRDLDGVSRTRRNCCSSSSPSFAVELDLLSASRRSSHLMGSSPVAARAPHNSNGTGPDLSRYPRPIIPRLSRRRTKTWHPGKHGRSPPGTQPPSPHSGFARVEPV